MNLLKGITEELKGSGESARTSDSGRSRTTPGRTREARESTSAPTASEPDREPRSGEPTRDDDHVCAFCGTEFPASRGACPDCDAEIIVRGER